MNICSVFLYYNIVFVHNTVFVLQHNIVITAKFLNVPSQFYVDWWDSEELFSSNATQNT